MEDHKANSQEIDYNESLDNRQDMGESILIRAVISKSILIRAVITLFAIALLYVHQIVGKTLDNVGLALFVIALFPWLVPFLRTSVESIEVLGNKIKFLETHRKKQLNLIGILYKSALHNLTTYEYEHLTNLHSGNSGGYSYNEFLPYEMVRLCHHGFVEEAFWGSTWKMKEKKGEKFNLADFYKITKRGEEHIALVDELQRRASGFGEQQ